MFLSFSACGDSKDNEKLVDKQGSKAESEHKENENPEAILTVQQYEALHIEIDTLAQRNISGYLEANGQLEVPPQNEATITSIIGANVVSIEVIEGDKINKNQVVAYISYPNIIQKQTDYLNAYSNSEYLQKEYERQKRLYDAGIVLE